MSEIKIVILEELNGKKPYMGMLFIDSYGDKLLKTLELKDIDPLNPDSEHFDNYFTVCTKCQLPVVDSSIVPDTLGMCDHCYIAGPSELTDEAMLNMVRTQTLPEDIMHAKHIENAKKGFASPEERIRAAQYMANEAFWKVIVDLFPECKTGDFLMSEIDETQFNWINHWVAFNTPEPAKLDSYRGETGYLNDLNLHYPETWHLWHSGGNCMLAATDNVAVGGQYNFLVISKDCVCVYQDTFKDGEFMLEHLCCWNFGDNPTVIMNQIDDFMGGIGYWDTGKLFDDIMTIAKSNKI